jgi:hypothetical protein
MSAAVKKEIEDHTRTMLVERLSLCTEKQRAFFVRLFGQPADVRSDDLVSAIDLCDRTIRANEKGRPTLEGTPTGSKDSTQGDDHER